MSAALEQTGSHDAATPTTERIDRTDKYVYDIPESDLRMIYCFLDHNDVWKKVADKMGYSVNDCIQFKQLANIERKSPTEVLISHCGDQNRTSTELFMVLYRLKQYPAMENLRKYVDKSYHRLIMKQNQMFEPKKGFNRPRISQETSESQTYEDSTNSFGFKHLRPKTSKIQISGLQSATNNYSGPLIPFSELQLATNNWNGEVLGKGGFGIVYKGNWKNTQVAIKRIAYQKQDADEKKKIEIQFTQSMNELDYLNRCRHDNVVPLYGFSNDGLDPCLVYQYMDGGSLEQRLRKGAINKITNKPWDPLTLKQRIGIAIGIARGLQYLHTFMDKPLIHGDIKPANILLDSNLVPKIGDFGLVREGSIESMEVSGAYGTRGYVPNEFIRQRTLSVKVDTFSYGVLLFELMTGLRAHDRQRDGANAFLAIYMWSHFKNDDELQDIRKFIDKTMEIDDKCFFVFKYSISMGLHCTNPNILDRPDMVFVLKNMNEKLGHYAAA